MSAKRVSVSTLEVSNSGKNLIVRFFKEEDVKVAGRKVAADQNPTHGLLRPFK